MPGRIRKPPQIFDPSPEKAAPRSPSGSTPSRARKPRLPRSASAPPSAKRAKQRRTKAAVVAKAKQLVGTARVAPEPVSSVPLSDEEKKLELIKMKAAHGSALSWKEICVALGSESDDLTIGAYKSVWQRFKCKWAHDVQAGIDDLQAEIDLHKDRRARGGMLLREMGVTQNEPPLDAPELPTPLMSPPAAQPKPKAAMKVYRVNVYGERGIGG